MGNRQMGNRQMENRQMKNRQSEKQINGQTDKWKTDKQTTGQTDKWTKIQMDKQTTGKTDKFIRQTSRRSFKDKQRKIPIDFIASIILFVKMVELNKSILAFDYLSDASFIGGLT